MGEPILSGSGLRKVFDGTVAVDNVSFAIEEKTITAIIGPNGAGKTTLFNLITGFIAPDAGEICLLGKNLNGTPPYQIAQRGLSRTFQDLRLLRQLSVRENLLLACPNQKGESFWPALLSSQVRKQTRAIEATLRIMDFAGLNPLMREQAGNLSYGQQKLLTLGCCLATEAGILLLDEPVAGVHPDMASQILRHLLQIKEEGRTIVFIEHDIDAVRRMADNVIVMDDGKVIASGPKNEVLANSEIIEAYLT
jgi:ABC-type branched-subunit amino acid transport system ATPase component